MQFRYLLGLLAILNYGLMFGAYTSNKEYYDETSRNLSIKYDHGLVKLNIALDGASVFDCLEGDSTVAKMYLTTKIMELQIKDFGLIVQNHKDLFFKTLFGRSLILGWMVHFYDEPGKLFQFNKETHSYDALFVAMGKKTGATSVVGQLTPLFDAAKFYTHSVWLPSASKELASSGYKPYNYPIQEAFDAALKTGNQEIKYKVIVSFTADDKIYKSEIAQGSLVNGSFVLVKTVLGIVHWFGSPIFWAVPSLKPYFEWMKYN